MSGTTISLFSRREFDFSQVQGNRCVAAMVVKAVDVSQYTMGTLEVRVHNRSISRPLALAARGAIRHAASLDLSAQGGVAESSQYPDTASFRLLALDENPGAIRRAGLRHGLLADICVLAYTTAPTGEAPGIDFIDWSSPVASISIDDSEAYAPPALATAPLAPGFGGMLAIFVHGQQPPVPAAALAAELSAFLTIKS